MEMLRSIGKHSGESMESVLWEETEGNKATVGTVCRKGMFVKKQ